jgi:hypothetical protein
LYGCLHFPGFIPGFTNAMLSVSRRRPHRQRDACGDFTNLWFY